MGHNCNTAVNHLFFVDCQSSLAGLLRRYPAENGYVDANSITFPWVVNKKDIPPDEVQGLDEFIQGKYGVKS